MFLLELKLLWIFSSYTHVVFVCFPFSMPDTHTHTRTHQLPICRLVRLYFDFFFTFHLKYPSNYMEDFIGINWQRGIHESWLNGWIWISSTQKSHHTRMEWNQMECCNSADALFTDEIKMPNAMPSAALDLLVSLNNHSKCTLEMWEYLWKTWNMPGHRHRT